VVPAEVVVDVESDLEEGNSWLAPGPTGSVGRDFSTGNLCFESASVALRPRNRYWVTVSGYENGSTRPYFRGDGYFDFQP